MWNIIDFRSRFLICPFAVAILTLLSACNPTPKGAESPEVLMELVNTAVSQIPPDLVGMHELTVYEIDDERDRQTAQTNFFAGIAVMETAAKNKFGQYGEFVGAVPPQNDPGLLIVKIEPLDEENVTFITKSGQRHHARLQDDGWFLWIERDKPDSGEKVGAQSKIDREIEIHQMSRIATLFVDHGKRIESGEYPSLADAKNAFVKERARVSEELDVYADQLRESLYADSPLVGTWSLKEPGARDRTVFQFFPNGHFALYQVMFKAGGFFSVIGPTLNFDGTFSVDKPENPGTIVLQTALNKTTARLEFNGGMDDPESLTLVDWKQVENYAGFGKGPDGTSGPYRKIDDWIGLSQPTRRVDESSIGRPLDGLWHMVSFATGLPMDQVSLHFREDGTVLFRNIRSDGSMINQNNNRQSDSRYQYEVDYSNFPFGVVIHTPELDLKGAFRIVDQSVLQLVWQNDNGSGTSPAERIDKGIIFVREIMPNQLSDRLLK